LHSFSLRKRLVLVATLVLVIALGLVGVALNAANYRGAVSSLQVRMESYVYLVLGAMEVSVAGGLEMDGDLPDPRLIQPSSGIYARVQGRDQQWSSESSLGLEWPTLGAADPGQVVFTETGAGSEFFTLIY
jgi:two-component system sensor histidine kinase PhoQ